ncbi:EAL domain-containing protein [Aliikangiella sp. IMCC44632]
MLKFFAALSLLFCCLSSAFALDKVSLQLKWEHEFQFAGYYAAKWQGYYQEAGIEVDILPLSHPNGEFKNVTQEVMSGRAQFGIGSVDLLVSLDQGADFLILAPIFQKSPLALFSLASSPIADLNQLENKRIAVINDSAIKSELQTLFKLRGYDTDLIKFVDEPPTIETLLNGKADVISTYQISAAHRAKELGVELSEFLPSNFGINFYSDSLFTSRAFYRQNPDLVDRFVKASLKGWEYAVKNKYSLANRISNELPRHIVNYEDLNAYNKAFADNIESLLKYPEVPIGHINPERWFGMSEQLRFIGLVRKPLDENFLYSNIQKNKDSQTALLTGITKVLVCLLLLSLIFILWYKRKLYSTLVVFLSLMLILEAIVEQEITRKESQEIKLELTRRLNSISAKLNGNLQINLSMLTGFSAYISAHPQISDEEFRSYARELFKKEPMLINFAAAKDLKVNLVYPLTGNEKVIGLDYLKTPAQKDMVLEVVNTGQLLVVGPVNLVQGGVAFIGRSPIFTGEGSNRKLWGIISAPLDADKLYRHSDVYQVGNDYQLSIKVYNTFNIEGKIIYGQKSTFDHPTHVQESISVGGGTWKLALAPKFESNEISNEVLISRLIALFISIVFTLLIIYRFNQEKLRLLLEAKVKKKQHTLIQVGKIAKIGGWTINSNGEFEAWSKQAVSMLSPYFKKMPSNTVDFCQKLKVEDAMLWKKKISDAFSRGHSFDIEISIQSKTIDNLWVRLIADVATKNSAHISGTIQDITSKIVDARIIQHQATYDALTDLPNRVLFSDRLTHAIERAERNNFKVAVLFIDLDRFKPVNDNHGHLVGDQLLIEAAHRILPCVRNSDTVSRLSGDEFGVLLVDINENINVLNIIEKIMGAMQAPYQIDDLSIHCSASIGIALYPDDASDADTLIRNADQAMYVVKSSGRNGWQFYTDEMQISSEYRHTLHSELIDAINSEQLIPYYQPIACLQEIKTVKCESLCRWPQTDGSFIPPNEFISIAEESGLINKIDIAMLKKSAAYLIQSNRTRKNKIGLSINISPRLFVTKDNALETWISCITELNKSLDITVEITERLLTSDSDKALDVLNHLKSLDIKIAIDDFGTGYSSLSYLVKFPVDIIKIDKSFVDQIGLDHSSETLIKTVIAMAKNMDIQVIAEGIETQEQLDFLTINGCDFGQGYFLGKPVAEVHFENTSQNLTLN